MSSTSARLVSFSTTAARDAEKLLRGVLAVAGAPFPEHIGETIAQAYRRPLLAESSFHAAEQELKGPTASTSGGCSSNSNDNNTDTILRKRREQDNGKPSLSERSLAIKEFELKKKVVQERRDENISQSKELYVPATRVERVFGFGRLAAGLAWGAASSRLDRFWNGKEVAAASTTANINDTTTITKDDDLRQQVDDIVDTFLSDTNAERLADGLSRLRGAALKLGQLLSMQDENVIPTALSRALERVRAQADFMPSSQKEMVLAKELGDSWREKFSEFDEKPFAAASIGQVHKATLHDNTPVVVKIQYPGVGLSIESDIDNLVRLVSMTSMLPKGLYIEHAVEVAKEELRLECDYNYESNAQARFHQLLQDEPGVEVPHVIESLSTERVLVTTFFDGIHIDKCENMPQSIRNDIATRILKITLRELWEFQFMQVMTEIFMSI